MTSKPRPRRVVPEFRGSNFAAARAIEREAEVKPADPNPADPNPDAPPLSAYSWQDPELVITTQGGETPHEHS